MFWFIIGLLLIYVGINGNLGAMLCALVTPDQLVDNSPKS